MDIAAHAITALTDGALIADFGQQTKPVLYVNEAFTSITGYSAGEALGRACEFFVLADAALSSTDANVLANVVARRKNGAMVDCSLVLSQMRPFTGATDPVLVLIRPLDTHREADAPGRAKYLRAIVHDLRSPLSACSMWTDILALDPAVEPTTAEIIASVKRSIQTMADMLDRLSRWAQVAFEAAPDKSERFALAVVLEELGNRWRALAAARGVGFEHSASESASTEIYADQDSVVQALDALLENALSATGEGGRIALCLEAVDDSVLVTVRDDGAGLTSDEIGHVFEPFWRGSQGGFGLGLAIAKHVATRHGGSLRATSEGPGLGAAFTLQLPAGLRGEAVTD